MESNFPGPVGAMAVSDGAVRGIRSQGRLCKRGVRLPGPFLPVCPAPASERVSWLCPECLRSAKPQARGHGVCAHPEEWCTWMMCAALMVGVLCMGTRGVHRVDV